MDLELQVSRSNKPGLPAVIAGGFAAAVPLVVQVSQASVTTVNGVVTSAGYRDYIAIGGGGVAVACGIIAAIAAGRAGARTMLVLGVVVALAGGAQLARGFGVFQATPSPPSATRAPSPVATVAAPAASACERGSMPACTDEGFAALRGEGVAKDAERARRLLTRACDGGHALGCRNLSVMYRDGEGVPKDEAIAVKLAAAACDLAGDEAEACKYAGVRMVEGNPTRARALFARACAAGPGHCHNLAIAHERGVGGAIDLGKARALYQEACNAGDLESCHNLGVMIDDNARSPGAKAIAQSLFRRACDGGIELACKSLKR